MTAALLLDLHRLEAHIDTWAAILTDTKDTTMTSPELLATATHAVATCPLHHADRDAAVADVVRDIERTRARILQPLPAAAWTQA